MIATIDVSQLGDLSEVGEGGEGRVYKIGNRPDVVYKQFRPEVATELDQSALERTILIPSRMTTPDRQFVEARTTWPRAVVVEGSAFRGFLMSILPQRTTCVHGVVSDPSERLCTWDLLSYRMKTKANPNLKSETSSVTEDHVRSVLLDFARLVDVLHRYRVVLGDISGRNILWPISGDPTVVVIDCDGMRTEGTRAVTKSKQSPDWIDPLHQSETNLNSDLYKLSLAMYRGYFSAATALPTTGPVASATDSLGQRIAEMARSAERGLRPSASEWVVLLEDSIQRGASGGQQLPSSGATTGLLTPVVTGTPAGGTSRPGGRPTLTLDDVSAAEQVAPSALPTSGRMASGRVALPLEE